MANGNGNGSIKGWISHGATSIVSVALGMLITYSTAVSTQKQDITRISEQIKFLTTISEQTSKKLETHMEGGYRAVDAKRDLELRDKEIEHNKERITKLESYHNGG